MTQKEIQREKFNFLTRSRTRLLFNSGTKWGWKGNLIGVFFSKSSLMKQEWMNYSEVKSVISCRGSELTSSCERKGASVSCWLRKLRSKALGRQSHRDALERACLPPTPAPCVPLSPFHPEAHLAPSLRSRCCCVINLACLKLIVLYLTSQSIGRIPLLVPRVCFQVWYKQEEFCQQFSQIFFRYFISR